MRVHIESAVTVHNNCSFTRIYCIHVVRIVNFGIDCRVLDVILYYTDNNTAKYVLVSNDRLNLPRLCIVR